MKSFLDLIKKGDLEAVKKEQEKLGINVSYMIDDMKHNAAFFAVQIKNEQQSL